MILKKLIKLNSIRPALLFFHTKTNPKKFNYAKYLTGFGLGVGAYLLANSFYNKRKEVATSEPKTGEPTLNLDLNEIYEKSAVVFLSNQELRDVLGLPIKITSSNELDQVRSLNLRREGNDLYAFLAYDVQGSINSGIVYCKLKMNKTNEKFLTQSVLVKLNKPDFKNRTQFNVKIDSKSN